jgi:hypothetical protein
MIATKTFALAGNATFTATSLKTGTRFTFKIRQPSPETPHFVKVLTGADNENNYTFLGTIFPDGNFRHGKRSTITPDAPSAKAFAYIWTHLDELTGKVEITHTGRCCRCGRLLTVPESVASGIGPECASKMGF